IQGRRGKAGERVGRNGKTRSFRARLIEAEVEVIEPGNKLLIELRCRFFGRMLWIGQRGEKLGTEIRGMSDLSLQQGARFGVRLPHRALPGEGQSLREGVGFRALFVI